MIRVLIADDFEAWRAKARYLLRVKPEWQIVGEAVDGLETIRKTIEIRPDVVLLDISMPGVSGLQACEKILQAFPETVVIFLSQNTDKEVANAALVTGAKGYVLKVNASRELIPAISRALLGRLSGPELR